METSFIISVPDQSLPCPHIEALDPLISTELPAKTIKLLGYDG